MHETECKQLPQERWVVNDMLLVHYERLQAGVSKINWRLEGHSSFLELASESQVRAKRHWWWEGWGVGQGFTGRSVSKYCNLTAAFFGVNGFVQQSCSGR